MGVDQLRASVSAGGSYTLVVLAGESDMNTRQQLRTSTGPGPRGGAWP